jgi:hypothetical protein
MERVKMEAEATLAAEAAEKELDEAKTLSVDQKKVKTAKQARTKAEVNASDLAALKVPGEAAAISQKYRNVRNLKLDLLYKRLIAENAQQPPTKEFIDREFPTETERLSEFIKKQIMDTKEEKICKIFFLIIYAYLFHNLLCATTKLSLNPEIPDKIEDYNKAKSDLHTFVDIIITRVEQTTPIESRDPPIESTDHFLNTRLPTMKMIDDKNYFCIKSVNVRENSVLKDIIYNFFHNSYLKKINADVNSPYKYQNIELKDIRGNVIRNPKKGIPNAGERDMYYTTLEPTYKLLVSQSVDFEILVSKIHKTDINAFINHHFDVELSNYPLVPNTVPCVVQNYQGGLFKLKRVSRTNKKGNKVSRTNNNKRISPNKNYIKINNNKKSRTKLQK